MERPLDYGLYARQIALPEVGPQGQRKLAVTPVDFGSAPALAPHLHARAGGLVEPDSPLRVDAAVRVEGAAQELGVSAWACVEAARRVLGEPPRAMPDALLARLAIPSAATKP